ncbi:MAG TPA: type IV pilus assembly protein PilM [Bdellovibrionales bacterium]|nr:type IV pilus assembly protein PilM [Bdellovibrionales bacterium]
MFFQSKKLIGLDIGTANIKMAEVDYSRKGSTLVNFVIAPTPSRAINGGEISDPGAISETLRTLYLELKTKRKAVSVGLWGTSVITKRITIPQMDEKLVGGQIRWEAEQYIPFDINDVNIDFKILRSFKGSPDSMDILLVAARQEIAFLYQDIVQSANLQCSVVDVSGFALANCYLNNWGSQKGQTVALMNIGAAITNFVVIESDEVIFCRDIPAGGLTYTSEIHKAMGVSLEEAEAMKISACTGQAAPEEVPRIIQSAHDTIAEEVQSSLDFFQNTTPGLPVQQCLVTGGGSRTLGLLNHLASHSKIGFQVFDPFRAVKINSKNLRADYVSEIRDFAGIALGLGMRAQGDA